MNLLTKFKYDYEKQYLIIKTRIKWVALHTEAHDKLIQQAHIILENIAKLNIEILNLSKNASTIEDTIKKDLQLKDV
jgi:hypothetical protein